MLKKISIWIAVLALVLAFPFTVFAQAESLLVDNAGLLSGSEQEEVLGNLNRVSDKYDVDVAVLTINSLEGKSMQAYADDYYDQNGYGRGADRSGALMLIDMGSRDSYLSTHGEGIKAFTDYGIEQLGQEVNSFLRSGDYAGAFDKYAEVADIYFQAERDGKPVDVPPRGAGFYVVLAVIALVAGFGFSFAVTKSMKNKMKSVRKQATANAYATDQGINLTESTDRYLYHNVVAVPIPKNDSSSGGSSTHTSSGGYTHGGGGLGGF